jgi:hypothetical protein
MALACCGRPVTFPTLGSFVLGSILNIALLSYGARRLLAEQRFSLSRTVIAGLAGGALSNAIYNALIGGIHLGARQHHAVRRGAGLPGARLGLRAAARDGDPGHQARLREGLGPASLKDAASGEIMALLPMLRRLPRRMDRIAAAVEGGRLSVNVRLLADERDRQTINGWLQLGLYQFLGYCLLVICSLLALRVLAAVFRAPR